MRRRWSCHWPATAATPGDGRVVRAACRPFAGEHDDEVRGGIVLFEPVEGEATRPNPRLQGAPPRLLEQYQQPIGSARPGPGGPAPKPVPAVPEPHRGRPGAGGGSSVNGTLCHLAGTPRVAVDQRPPPPPAQRNCFLGRHGLGRSAGEIRVSAARCAGSRRLPCGRRADRTGFRGGS